VLLRTAAVFVLPRREVPAMSKPSHEFEKAIKEQFQKNYACLQHKAGKVEGTQCGCYKAGLEKANTCLCITDPNDNYTPDCLCFLTGLLDSFGSN
jgi:hypothetical protein